jgi:hypothetical protein
MAQQGKAGGCARRGQLSLEALVALSALLASLSLLAYAASDISSSFRSSVGASAANYSLSYSALCLDTAAYSLQGARAGFAFGQPVSAGGYEISSAARGIAKQRLLHRATADSKGGVHVESSGRQPV